MKQIINKIGALLLIGLLGTFILSCEEDNEPEVRTGEFVCTLRSAKTSNSSDSSEVFFVFNNRRQMAQYSLNGVVTKINYYTDSIVNNFSGNGAKEKLFLENGSWVKSEYTNQYQSNDTTFYTNVITSLPTYSDYKVTKINWTRINYKKTTNTKTVTITDSATILFAYNQFGDVISIRNSKDPILKSYNLQYDYNTQGFRANEYINYSIGNKYLESGLSLALLTGKLRLFDDLPTSLNLELSALDKLIFINIQEDKYNVNTAKVTLTGDGVFASRPETLSFTYDCR